MIKLLLLWFLNLLAEKVIVDNLISFKIKWKRSYVKAVIIRRKLILYREQNNYSFDMADFIFGRLYMSLLFVILILCAIGCTVDYINHSENNLAFQLFNFKVVVLFAFVITISFLPLPPKPKKHALNDL